MLKKLMAGEFSLSDTFWKFGVLGLVIVVFVVRFFGSMLAQKLAGISLWLYFTRYFHPLKMNTGILVLAVCYLGCLAAFVFYSVVLVSGTWKSSAEYDKSIWLRHISRIMMLLMLFICYKMIF
ncbi:MAG: hypothetical protein Q4F75_07940 [Pseudomonadota bacterium]|nr:hypothetical protein [Pseudomonadota bacterium]